MKREHAQEAFFGRRPVRDNPASVHGGLHPGPQINKPGSPDEPLIADAMHGPRGPCHAPAGQEIGRKSRRDIASVEMRDGDLHRLVREPRPGAGSLKINGSEGNFSDLQAKSRSVAGQSKQASVIETPYCKAERSAGSGWLPP